MRNHPRDPSRRAFVATGAAALLSMGATRLPRFELTAQQAVDRIRANAGVPWRETTVDTFKAGDPQTVVTGIATTVMATLPVLRQAAGAGRNLIVTWEPTFYNGNDDPGTRAADPVYLAKKKFIEEHRLVIWRFSDHWGARVPNELTSALADTLGWAKLRTAGNPLIYSIPSTTLGALAAHTRARLGVRGGMRIIGKSGMRIQRVLLSPGTTSLQTTIDNLPQADVILSGEPREWEAVEYVADTAAAGQPKGMIAVGRVVSEEPGMRACAAWLRTLVPEVPVEAIAVGDPYWRPPPSPELRRAGAFAKASASAKATADKTEGRPL
jgi:putative NIF3 family GTP cyclohydrolase 1 type 2